MTINTSGADNQDTGTHNTSLHDMFNAGSLAVVGASNDPEKLGYMTLDSIIKGGYRGKIYPVNPKGGLIHSLESYSSLTDIPEEVELAVIVVPAKFVPAVMREAAEKHVRGAVILSAGFRESGRQDLEDELLSIARESGIRFIGPNVQGVNYLPNRLCAMFFPVITMKGPLTVLSQSGSVTAALSEWAVDEGLGLMAAINLGNQTDLYESDYLDYLSGDNHIDSIAVYLEGVRDGRRFLESMERLSSRKPVVVLKSGQSAIGRKAVESHTGALSGSHEVFEAACRQVGAITALNIEDLFDRSKGTSIIKLPAGNRVLSISTSGGMGALAADSANREKLIMPPLPEDFVKELKESGLVPLSNFSNPLDLGYLPSAVFSRVAEMADRRGFVDVILLNFGDPMPGCVEAALELSEKCRASIVVNYLGGGEQEKEDRVRLQRVGLPVFPTPDRAMKGISAAIQASERKREGMHCRGIRDWRLPEMAAVNDPENPVFLTEPEGIEKLSAYRLPYPDWGLATSESQAVDLAERIGYPVVLKLVSLDIVHKSEAGGVITGVRSTEGVREAYRRILDNAAGFNAGAALSGALVCRDIPSGTEVIVGAARDPVFGPVIMFGMGGIFTEILEDVSFRIAPLIPTDIDSMIKEINGYPMLSGARGKPACDLAALTDLIQTVSSVMVENPDIAELDLNPVRFHENGLSVLDVRIMLRG